MNKALTPAEAIALIRQHIGATDGTQSAFAKRVGVSAAVVSQALNGLRSPPDAMLKDVGLAKTTAYVKRNKN